jgi:hypothetical protein
MVGRLQDGGVGLDSTTVPLASTTKSELASGCVRWQGGASTSQQQHVHSTTDRGQAQQTRSGVGITRPQSVVPCTCFNWLVSNSNGHHQQQILTSTASILISKLQHLAASTEDGATSYKDLSSSTTTVALAPHQSMSRAAAAAARSWPSCGSSLQSHAADSAASSRWCDSTQGPGGGRGTLAKHRKDKGAEGSCWLAEPARGVSLADRYQLENKGPKVHGRSAPAGSLCLMSVQVVSRGVLQGMQGASAGSCSLIRPTFSAVCARQDICFNRFCRAVRPLQLSFGSKLKDNARGSPFWLSLLLALSRPISADCLAAALLLVLLM